MRFNQITAAAATVLALAGGAVEAFADDKQKAAPTAETRPSGDVGPFEPNMHVPHDQHLALLPPMIDGVRDSFCAQIPLHEGLKYGCALPGTLHASLHLQPVPAIPRVALPRLSMTPPDKKHVDAILSATQGLVIGVTGEHTGVNATSTNLIFGPEIPVGNGDWVVSPEAFVSFEVPVGADGDEKTGQKAATPPLKYFVGGGLTVGRKFGRVVPTLTAFGGAVGHDKYWTPVVGFEPGLEVTLARTSYVDVAGRAAVAVMNEGLVHGHNHWIVEPQLGLVITGHRKEAGKGPK